MRDFDGNQVEMSREDQNVDLVLRGESTPEDGELAGLARFVTHVQSAFSEDVPPEVASGHLMRTLEAGKFATVTPGALRSQRGVLSGSLSGALASLGAAVLLAILLTGGAAYAGALPGPVQSTVSDLAGSFGLSLASDEELEAIADAKENLQRDSEALQSEVTDFVACIDAGDDSCTPPDPSPVVSSAQALVEATGVLRGRADQVSTYGECIAAAVAELQPDLSQGLSSLETLLAECGPLPIDDLDGFPDDFDLPPPPDVDSEAIQELFAGVREAVACVREAVGDLDVEALREDPAALKETWETLKAAIAACEFPEPSELDLEGFDFPPDFDFDFDFELPDLPEFPASD